MLKIQLFKDVLYNFPFRFSKHRILITLCWLTMAVKEDDKLMNSENKLKILIIYIILPTQVILQSHEKKISIK